MIFFKRSLQLCVIKILMFFVFNINLFIVYGKQVSSNIGSSSQDIDDGSEQFFEVNDQLIPLEETNDDEFEEEMAATTEKDAGVDGGLPFDLDLINSDSSHIDQDMVNWKSIIPTDFNSITQHEKNIFFNTTIEKPPVENPLNCKKTIMSSRILRNKKVLEIFDPEYTLDMNASIYMFWKNAINLSEEAVYNTNSILQRYIVFLRTFLEFPDDKQKVRKILEPERWCNSINKLCMEPIRRAGFIIEKYAKGLTVYNTFLNWKYVHYLKDNNIKIDFENENVQNYVDFLKTINLYIMVQSLDSPTMLINDVQTFCRKTCIDDMLNSGYKDESRWNKVRAECKSHNTYYKLKVCPRLFSEKFHFGVRLPSLRLMEMEEWCESSCI